MGRKVERKARLREVARPRERARQPEAARAEPLLVRDGEDVTGRALGEHARVVEHDHVVAAGGVVHGVRDLDDGDAARRERAEYGTELLSPAGIEAGGGLVQHEGLRVHGEDPGDGAQALLAAGEVERGGLAQV